MAFSKLISVTQTVPLQSRMMTVPVTRVNECKTHHVYNLSLGAGRKVTVSVLMSL